MLGGGTSRDPNYRGGILSVIIYHEPPPACSVTVVAFFMDHERVLLVHLGDGSLPHQCPAPVISDAPCWCSLARLPAAHNCGSLLSAAAGAHSAHMADQEELESALTQWLTGIYG